MTRDFICVGHLKSGITYLRNFCHVFSSITVFFHCINTLLNQMQAIIEISLIEFFIFFRFDEAGTSSTTWRTRTLTASAMRAKSGELLKLFFPGYSLDSNNVNVVDNLGKTIITRPIPAPGSAAII